MNRFPLIALGVGMLLLSGAAGAAPAQKPVAVVEGKKSSVVRVNVTSQPPDFFRPWTRRPPYSRRALGAVLPGNRVLVTAEMVANATFVELEKAESGDKMAATVVAVDYEADLALLKPADEKFLASFKPLEIEDAKVGDHVATWQLENNGNLLATDALVTTVEVARYPIDEISLLVYRLTSSLQYREGSFTVPIIKGGKLAGLLMRYDSRTQNVDAVPAPVIAHFLKAAAAGDYVGFPRLGVAFSAMRDPELRQFAGVEKVPGGVYLGKVVRGGSAGASGLQVGDVVLSIGGQAIDQDGNYLDPVYGKISVTNLISTRHFSGDTLPVKLYRAGQPLTLDLKLQYHSPRESVIEPYTIDHQPNYYVVGGLVLQELSRQFLKEWGAEWYKKAPERFLYYDRYQTDLFHGPRKKIVILSQVLPSPATIGYEGLSYLEVVKINDVPLLSLADVQGALAKPIDGFHKIEFADSPRVIYLDAAAVAEQEPGLLRNYGLTAVKHLE